MIPCSSIEYRVSSLEVLGLISTLNSEIFLVAPLTRFQATIITSYLNIVSQSADVKERNPLFGIKCSAKKILSPDSFFIVSTKGIIMKKTIEAQFKLLSVDFVKSGYLQPFQI